MSDPQTVGDILARYDSDDWTEGFQAGLDAARRAVTALIRDPNLPTRLAMSLDELDMVHAVLKGLADGFTQAMAANQEDNDG